MQLPFRGGCACQHVRYSCNAEPIVQLICHCRDCQQADGGPAEYILFVPADALDLDESELRYREVVGASGRRLQRGFCPECGSHVSLRWPDGGLVKLLHAGSLDDPAEFAPQVEVWTSRAAPWHPIDTRTEKFDEGPSLEAVRGRVLAYLEARQSKG